MSEMFDVLDENGKPTGKTKDRVLIHRDGDWHKAVHVWIVNDDGEILLQRRSPNKDSNPNMLDISIAGHITAGSDSLTTATQEIKEALGLDVKSDNLQFIETIKKSSKYTSDFINNEFDDMYIMRTNAKVFDMTLQKEEVTEVFFVPFDKFVEMVESHQPDLLRHEEEFGILFELFNNKEER